MPTVADNQQLTAFVRWAYARAITGFSPAEQHDEMTTVCVPSATTYNHVFLGQYVLAPAGTQAVDFFGPWTSVVCESVTATKIVAVRITATGNSTLEIKPHATNGLAWPFKGTAPTIELKPSTVTAIWMHADGTHAVLSSTVRQWMLTNTGAASLTVNLVAFCGT